MTRSSKILPPVLNAAAMGRADRYTIQTLGLGGFTLMETAGRAVADLVCGLDMPERVLCLCGKGNNGGDGFVTARILADRGYEVRLVTTAARDRYTGEAARHLDLLMAVREEADPVSGAPNVAVQFDAGTDVDFRHGEIVVDALLGTGISSDVREPLASLIGKLNEFKADHVVSVDIPSGIDSDTGRVLGVGVRAQDTVTMAARKTGHLLGEGADYTGAVHVADIGIPTAVIERECTSTGCARLSSDSYVCDRLPPRHRSDHKYSTGPTLVIGGSKDFPGAPVLAANAAARVGSGYVVACCPESVRHHLLEKLTEIPVATWPDQAHPTAGVKALQENLGNRWAKARSMLIGPGLGRSEKCADFVKAVLESFDGPIVVDADALYALINDPDWVRSRADGRWIFTPHFGEFQRLLNRDEGIHDRIEAAAQLAENWNVTLLLKGLPSLTTAPGQTPIINSTGNPAAGTAGTGDVLAGIVAGLAAQGLTSLDAAAVGVHLAGVVADRFVKSSATRSMMAGDVVTLLPDTLAEICGAA